MSDKRCGTCNICVELPLRSSPRCGVCRIKLPPWQHRASITVNKDDGADCPCWKPKETATN